MNRLLGAPLAKIPSPPKLPPAAQAIAPSKAPDVVTGAAALNAPPAAKASVPLNAPSASPLAPSVLNAPPAAKAAVQLWKAPLVHDDAPLISLVAPAFGATLMKSGKAKAATRAVPKGKDGKGQTKGKDSNPKAVSLLSKWHDAPG